MGNLDRKKVKDEETGEEKEVYEADQVEATLKEKEDTFKADKEKLEADLKKATEDLAKSNEKAGDFKELREAKEKVEKDLKDATEKHQKEIDDIKANQVKEQRDKMFELLSAKDEEVKKKMDYFSENELKGMPRGTKEEIDKLASAAYKLATGITDDNKINSIISSAGGGKVDTSKVSPELTSLGKKFGLTDKDWEEAEKKGVI